MADPLGCLRAATISIAIWNIIYCFIQFGLLGWQFQVVKDILAEYENRQLPATGAIDGFQARFPGLYQIYTETPERRRANAMYVIIIVAIILAIGNLLTSVTLLYAAIKYLKVLIWPWFATSIPLCIMTTVYAVLWWSGDVFNEQLSFSIFEFVMSVAVNSITIIVVIVFFSRLNGSLLSTRPKHSRRRKRKHVQRVYLDPNHYNPRHNTSHAAPYLEIDTGELFSPKPRGDGPPPSNLPDWRREWPSLPDVELQKKMKRRRKEERRRDGYDVAFGAGGAQGVQGNTIDFYAPEAGDAQFPWKMKTLEENYHERRKTQANKIKTLYYQHWPEDLPNMPIEMRRRMQEERENDEIQRNKSRLKYFEDV
ncbi:unnamed protein product [Caenorhabditis angaria]|uniref:Uncharacterized protein n=1 Tax=Caenorhabditis angaria TaxID=860376 RepID=A0A9P1MYM2_9PELO|nr:unnamed protein product [Caenorhabditis angaria]